MISAGEFWVADIPYTDQRASKKRPVLVLWLDAADVVVAVVTTAAPRSASDVALQDWQASGLRAASTVRLSRLDCLEQSLLVHRIGTFVSRRRPRDRQRLGTTREAAILRQV